MYPNLFVIGAAKSGTSSLHYYLGLHPEIHMSADKEPHYFTQLAGGRAPVREYTDAEYQRLFDSDLPVRGESSVTYSFHPYPAGVSDLIADAAPDARIIYLVRDPVDRAVAHYNHRVALGTETRSLDDVVRSPVEERERYIAASSYATQLEQYQRRFPADRILVLDHRDLLLDRPSVLRETFAFLGVDESFRSLRFDAKVNESRHDRQFSPAARRLRRSAAYRRATAWIRPDVRKKVVAPLRNVLSRPAPRVEASAWHRAAWADALTAEAARFRSMTGRSFEHWSV